MKRALILLGAVVALLGAVEALAQDNDLSRLPPPSKDFQPKQTPWGEPDFRGGWPIDSLNGRTPLQREEKYGDRALLTDAEFAERAKMVDELTKRYANEDAKNQLGIGHWAEVSAANRRTSWITSPANGRLPPFTEEGKRLSAAMRSTWRQNQTFDWVTDFDTWDRCITRGLPASMFPFMYNNGIRIFQSPGLVAIQLEMVHETRLIPTDGRPGLPTKIQNWLGESRGHWEGKNVLVVETTNLHPGPSATNIGTTGSPPQNDTPVSDRATMIERFTMTGPNAISYEMTWNDPVVFAAPWSARLDWQRDDNYGIFEYACHEGDVQIRNYITASRAQRAQEKAAAVAQGGGQ